MVKLTDLYHGDARLFGLVRIGNRFISTHPNDPRHEAVMLKTIEALQAQPEFGSDRGMRQFLVQHPRPLSVQKSNITPTLCRGRESKATAAAYHDLDAS